MINIIHFITPELSTVCLAGLLLLSLVLPLMAGWLEPGDANTARPGRRVVWMGQILAGLCGVLILVVPKYSILWLVTAVIVTAVFARKLRRMSATQL